MAVFGQQRSVPSVLRSFFSPCPGEEPHQVIFRLLTSRRTGANPHCTSLAAMRRGVREFVRPFEAVKDMGSALEDPQRNVSRIARSKLMDEISTCARTFIVVILATNENANSRLNEFREVRTGHIVVEPANGIHGDGRFE